MNRPKIPIRRLALAWTAWMAISVPAHADGPLMPHTVPPSYPQECGACHTAYPPGMLPAASWRRIMDGLADHYGGDASLTPTEAAPIAAWLQQHAGTWRRVSRDAPLQDRITRSEGFLRKHRKIDAAVWALPSVRSPAQCSACHTRAEEGRFSEHELRPPAGIDPRHRRAFDD